LKVIYIAKITLKLLSLFWDAVGSHELTYEGNTINEILTKFIEQYGKSLDKSLIDHKTKRLRPYILVLINGRNILFLNGFNTSLHDGDVIAISPPIAGG
jgi:molybdopterin synthase sulfur carrier subunit